MVALGLIHVLVTSVSRYVTNPRLLSSYCVLYFTNNR